MKQLLSGNDSLHSEALDELRQNFEIVPLENSPQTTHQVEALLQQYPKAVAMLLSPNQTAGLVKVTAKTPLSVSILRSCDCLMVDEGSAWPVLGLPMSLRSTIVKKTSQLDTTKCVYMLGQNKIAEIFIWTFLDMGFRHVKWILSDDDMISDRLEQIKAHFLGAKIELLKISKLSQQETDGVVLASTLPSSVSAQRLGSLGYFNYLRRNAVLIEYCPAFSTVDQVQIPHEGPEYSLMSEAVAAGLSCISRSDIDLESANHFLR